MASDATERIKAKPFGLCLFALIGLYASLEAGPVPPGLPDPSAGQIDGKVAITVVPQGVGKSDPLLPWGFVAHLTGYDDPDVEFEFPCGNWSQPPRGRYRVWIEGDWQISPFTHVIRFSPQPFRGRGLVTSAAIGPAGRVTLPPGVGKSPGLSLRLLHAGAYLEAGYPRWELSRRRNVREVGNGLLMPAGLAIGALWDEQSESYVALSRPFEVKARKTVTVPLEKPPSGQAYLVAQIERTSLAKSAEETRMKVELYRNGQRVPADLQIALTDRTYAVWYAVAPGPGELHAEGGDSFLHPQPVKLVGGRIERRLVTMTPQPVWDGKLGR